MPRERGAASRLRDVLDRLEGFLRSEGHGQALDEVLGIKEKLGAGQIQVVVMGEFKRGKSTLINALAGRPVLPMGVVPLTSVVTVVHRSERETAVVEYLDGRRQDVPHERVQDFVTEELNPKNERKVDRVSVGLNSPLLREGVLLVDTPGVGSVYRHNTEVTQRYLPQADAVVLVLSSDPPISQSEVEFLHSVRRWARKLFVVLNKADYLDAADLQRAVSFTEKVVREALGDARARVHPISAKTALEARTSAKPDLHAGGIEPLTSSLERLGIEEKEEVLFTSSRRRCADLIRALGLGLELEIKALTEASGESDARIAALSRSLETIKRRQYEADKLFSAEVKDHVAGMEESLYDYAGKEQKRIFIVLEKLYPLLIPLPSSDFRDKLNRAFLGAVEESYSGYLEREEASWAAAFQSMAERYLESTLALANQALKDAAETFGVEPRSLGKPAISVSPPSLWFVLEEVSIWSYGFLSLPTLRLFKPFFWKAMKGKVREAMDINAGRLRYDYSRRIEKAADSVRGSIQAFFQSAIEDVQKAVAASAARKTSSEQSIKQRVSLLGQKREAISGCLAEIERLFVSRA